MNAKIIEPEAISKKSACVALRCLLSGAVQGVGMRPALLLLAQEVNVAGWVRNVVSGVELHIEGKKASVERFMQKIVEPNRLPSPPTVQLRQVVESENCQTFSILPNDCSLLAPTVDIPVDRVACKKCREEYSDFAARRYRYPLISCSECGPRFTILEKLPFDRQATSMKGFVACSNCQAEYRNTSDRRLHSQVICCPKCGPVVVGIADGIEAIVRKEVVALRGLGGYQFVCLATSAEAIDRLRQIKQRLRKPLAIMVSQEWLSTSIRNELIIRRLMAEDGPIVIVPKSEMRGPAIEQISQKVSPNLSSLGIMLPTTLLHEELIEACGPLVVTSANRYGEPIIAERSELETLRNENDHVGLALIDHNRPIVNRIDDSVLNYQDSRFSTIRPGRGIAPKVWDLRELGFESALNKRYPYVLAVGGEQKVALAWCNGQQLIMGPFIGDIDTMPMRNYFDEYAKRICQLYRLKPATVVHDLHPDFYTSRWAAELASKDGVAEIAVQHHYAHLLSALVEPRWLKRKVLGFVWDGTGLGDDGVVWGGECFIADQSHYQRAVSLLPFVLPGGEAAIREPWRVAYALLRLSEGDNHFERFEQLPVKAIDTMLRNDLQATKTSSMGRLFDGVAALILDQSLSHSPATYEGEFAQILEEICDRDEYGCYDMPLVQVKDPLGGGCLQLDWRCMIRQIVKEQAVGMAKAKIAMKFHRTLANVIPTVANFWGDFPIVLSGGCFQNRLLLELIAETEIEKKRSIAWPGLLPVNDSGIAVGQVVAALVQAEKKFTE